MLTCMVPSSCAAERSLSTQKSVNSLIRNTLTHRKVARLTAVRMKRKVMEALDITEDGQNFILRLLRKTGRAVRPPVVWVEANAVLI